MNPEEQNGLAYELGATIATIKFAHDNLPEACRNRLLSFIPEGHRDLVTTHQSVVAGKN